MFSLFMKACLLYKTFKIVVLRFTFTIYDMGIPGVTRGYRGLQEVTIGDKRLQRVTWGYKGLQGVTKGLRRFKVVTRGDGGLQGVAVGYKG